MEPVSDSTGYLLGASGSVRPVMRLALPVLAEEALSLLVGYTDWWLAGHFLGTTEHKAAMGLLAYVLWLLPSLFAAIAIGATALVSRNTGAGNRRQASRVANQSILIGALLAALVTAVVYLGGSTFISAMQLHDTAAELTARYLWILLPAIPFIMIEQVGAACLRGAGDTVSGFVAKSIVNVVNVVLSTLLVLGPGPIPALGWEGLAIGTACGHILGGTLLMALMIRGRAGLRIHARLMKPRPTTLRRILRIGLPGGFDVFAVLTCHLIYVSIINGLGTVQAAAHGLGVQIEALSYLPGAAFAVAATTVAGQYLGAGQPKRAVHGVMSACLIGCSVMTFAGLTFYFGGGWLAYFFTGDPTDEVGQMTAQLLKIVAVSTPFLGVLQILTGALRGAGDTRFPLLVTFVGLLGIRIPLACYLGWEMVEIDAISVQFAGWGWGIYGAWWAMVIDVFVRSAMVSIRLWQGGWKSIRV